MFATFPDGPRFRRFPARAIHFGILVLSLGVGCSESSERTGEIELFKIATEEAVARTDRTSNTYILKGRGFSLSDNANRVMDAFQEFDHVGPLRMINQGESLFEEALRAYKGLIGMGEANRPETAKLGDLVNRAEEWLKMMMSQLGAPGDVKNSVRLKEEWRLEIYLEAFVERIRATHRFLEHLRDSVIDIREELKEPFFERPIFELVFEVAGIPLAHSDWNRRPQGYHRIDERLFKEKYFSQIQEPLMELLQYHAQLPYSKQLTPLNVDRKKFLDSMGRLQPTLKRILEWSLDLSAAVREGQLEVRTFDLDQTQSRKRDRHLDLLNLDIEKSLMELCELERLLRDPSRQIASVFIKERVDLEQMARELASLTHRDFNHPLLPARGPGVPPTFVTILLKTLFIRFLGDSGATAGSSAPPEVGRQDNRNTAATPVETRSCDLLVTAALKHSRNAEEDVYPLIFETGYAPGHFVNRHDRIVYGPYPYAGEFLDLRLTVMKLNDLNNNAILSGFSSVASAASNFNPELAVLSPVVTALFGSILKAATRNERELDASFTFPGAQGAGKADVDMLLTETGHYVILKRENSFRRERPLRPSDAKMIFRKLIYNGEDGRLYYRRYFSDPRSNFTPQNQFRDQSYAILVVTDEYTQQDDLGAMLRKQVGRALGEARAQELVPDLKKSADLIQSYHQLRREDRELKRNPENLNPVQLAQRQSSLQKNLETLWKQSSELQKQILVEALHDQADPETRHQLGKDPELWKRADLTLSKDGLIALKTGGILLGEVSAVPAGAKVLAFGQRDRKREWRFHLIGPTGADLADAGDQESKFDGFGSISKEGIFSPAAAPIVPSVRVRAVSEAQNGEPRTLLEQTVVYRGDHLLGTVVQEGEGASALTVAQAPAGRSVSFERNVDAKLKLNVKCPDLTNPSGTADDLIWGVRGNTLAKGQSATIEGIGTVKIDATSQFLTLETEPGKSAEAAESLRIVAMPAAYKNLLILENLQEYPLVAASLTLRNPLSFAEGGVRITLDGSRTKAKTVSSLNPVLADKLKATVGTKKVTWTVTIRQTDQKITPVGPLGPIQMDPNWFDADFLKTVTGDLILTGTIEGETMSVKRKVPYVVVKE